MGFLITARFIPQVCAGAAAPRPHKTCPEASGEHAGQGTHLANFPAAGLSFAQAPQEQPTLPPAPQRGRGAGGPPPVSPAACGRAAVPTEATGMASPALPPAHGRGGYPTVRFWCSGQKSKAAVSQRRSKRSPVMEGGRTSPCSSRRDSCGTSRPSRQPEDASAGGLPASGTHGTGSTTGAGSALNQEQRRGQLGLASTHQLGTGPTNQGTATAERGTKWPHKTGTTEIISDAPGT